MKKLSKNEMKNVMGGDPPSGDPGTPTDGGGGYNGGQYKCCWTGTTNCSICVPCTSSCVCVSGATLTECLN